MSDITLAKQQFVESEGVYLLSHSIGMPSKECVEAANKGFFNPWMHAPVTAWDHWLKEIDRFRRSLALFLGAKPSEICPQANVSSGLSKLIGALKKGRNNFTIGYSENDFPSTGFVIQRHASDKQETVVIPQKKNFLDLDTWDEYLNPESIDMIIICHVQYDTGVCVPVKEILSIARDRGIFSIVDVAQSVGIVSIDLNEWQADAVIGSSIKWLCGGPGAGFLYVNEKTIEELKPSDVGWFSHENPFEFDINNFNYAKDALRFIGGSPSVAPFVNARHSIDLLHNIGVDTIRAHNLTLSRQLIEGLNEHEVISPLEPAHRGGTVIVRPNNPDTAAKHLKANLVHHDVRRNAIRLSPHIYNTQAEIELVCDLFEEG